MSITIQEYSLDRATILREAKAIHHLIRNAKDAIESKSLRRLRLDFTDNFQANFQPSNQEHEKIL